MKSPVTSGLCLLFLSLLKSHQNFSKEVKKQTNNYKPPRTERPGEETTATDPWELEGSSGDPTSCLLTASGEADPWQNLSHPLSLDLSHLLWKRKGVLSGQGKAQPGLCTGGFEARWRAGYLAKSKAGRLSEPVDPGPLPHAAPRTQAPARPLLPDLAWPQRGDLRAWTQKFPNKRRATSRPETGLPGDF